MQRSQVLCLEILGCIVQILCDHAKPFELLHAYFGQMLADGQSASLSFTAGFDEAANCFWFTAGLTVPFRAQDEDEFVSTLEQEIVLALQKLRSDLLFVHGAALEFEGRALLLVGASGRGKSTIAWALVNNGFRYLSDELCPLDPDKVEVHPYTRAICLKSPSSLYPFPGGTVFAGRSIYIPARILPTGTAKGPVPVSAIFFLNRSAGIEAPELAPIPNSEAALQLFMNSLNSLAHPHAGLSATSRIVKMSACFKLVTADPQATAGSVKRALDALHSR